MSRAIAFAGGCGHAGCPASGSACRSAPRPAASGRSCGCASRSPGVDRQRAPADLPLSDRAWGFGSADASRADGTYPVRWDVRLPTQLRPGDATLSARDAEIHVIVRPV